MGKILSYKCQDCGHIWDRYEGSGFNSKAYHCDRCGKEIFIDISDYSDHICDCKGKYTSSAQPICEHCRSNNISINGDIAALWD